MPPRTRRRRTTTDGPVPIPVPKAFRRHHAALSAFSRANRPARPPVMVSVSRIRALTDYQLDELCEDVVVLLPLWRTGFLNQGTGTGSGGVIGVVTGGSTPESNTGPGAIGGGPPTPGGGPVLGYSAYGPLTTNAIPSPVSSAPTSSVSSPVLPQTQLEASPAMMPISALMNMDSLSSSSSSASPSQQQSSYHPHFQASAPNPALSSSSHSLHYQPHPQNPSPQTYHLQQSFPPTPHQHSPNPQLVPPPTEADARALAPNLPLWLPHAPRKRNESRVRLARSFMAGFEGMKALVWDVCAELERRWPLRE